MRRLALSLRRPPTFRQVEETGNAIVTREPEHLSLSLSLCVYKSTHVVFWAQWIPKQQKVVGAHHDLAKRFPREPCEAAKQVRTHKVYL